MRIVVSSRDGKLLQMGEKRKVSVVEWNEKKKRKEGGKTQTLRDVVRETKQLSQNGVAATHQLQKQLSGTVGLCEKVHGLLL